MKRWITAVAVLVALIAIAWLVREARRDEQLVRAADHIRALSTVDAESVVLIGLDLPETQEKFLYELGEDGWRCRSASQALALNRALDGLVEDLTAATGTTRLVAAERRSAFGLSDDAPRVTFFGPAWRERDDRDELATFVLGSEVEGRRSYLRSSDGEQVWEIDRLPKQHFAREPDDRLPPMLDRRLLAGELPTSTGGFTRAFLDYADGTSLELARVGAPDTYRWELRTPDADPVPALPYRVAGWQSFVYRTPYAGFAAPSEAPRVGLESAWLTLTLIDGAGAIELQLAEPRAGSPLAVLNSRSKMLVLLAPESAELLVPTTDDFIDRSRLNRWEDWLGAGAIRR